MAVICAAVLGSQALADTTAPVTYTAKRWLPGLTVVVPNSAWTIYEDQPGEFSLNAPAALAGTLHFWLDPHASGPLGAALAHPVAVNPGALTSWLRSNRNLVVSKPAPRTVAAITTTSVKLDLSRQAPREDPSCTTACLTYLVFRGPGYNFPFGTARGEPVRLYLATVRRNGQIHTLAIAVSAPARTFASVDRIANAILAKTTLPPTLKRP